MALSIQTEITLPATPTEVWAVLTDFAEYPNWNPFLTHVNGDWMEGNTVAITAGGMSFKPVVLDFQPPHNLRWRGKLLFNGLFDGEHYFRLQDQGDGSTLLIHGEDFSGALVPLFRKKLLLETKAGFEAMNTALAERLRMLSAENPPDAVLV